MWNVPEIAKENSWLLAVNFQIENIEIKTQTVKIQVECFQVLCMTKAIYRHLRTLVECVV